MGTLRRAALLCTAIAACTTTTRDLSPPAIERSTFEPLASTATIAARAIAADRCPRTEHAFAQPIAITGDISTGHWPPVAGFPIAFPRAASLRSLAGFRVTTRDGRPLPSQLEVLSRWGEAPDECSAPIRWAYAFVLGELRAPGRAYLSLRHDPGIDPAMTPALSAERHEDRILIDTGRTRFVVRPDRIELGDRSISIFVEKDGALISAREGRPLAFELERAGPAVATVRIAGTYGSIFRFTLRLHFYAGTRVIAVDHTYYNGELTDLTARGGKKRAHADRVFMRVPLDPGAEVLVRSGATIEKLRPAEPIALEQHKRTPDRPEVVSSILHGKKVLHRGGFIEDPMLAVSNQAIATLAYLGARDPQALRYDPRSGHLDLDFQSEPMWIGGARGIWSKAIIDFDVPADPLTRGTQLYAHVSRPLIGAPSVAYLNTTRAYGTLPAGELGGDFARFDRDVDRIHDRTADYLRKNRITGTQLWPDLPRDACRGAECAIYFEGGDNNYWDWSLVELEQFLRTADPSFLHDFALPEAITMAETISFRPNLGVESSFGGFAPCYGSGRGEDGEWLEGLNHRRGTCPGDYSYNKVHRLAYLLTADRRFLDFFIDGAETAIRMYKDPPRTEADKWLELSASRTTYQYLEPLLDAAELVRDPRLNRRYRDRAIGYFEHMRTRALDRGHTCNLLGTRVDDPRLKGDCSSDQAWMLPVWIEWVARLAELYDHAPARAWLLDFAAMSAARHTVLDDRGLPDLSRERSAGGWRTIYRCPAGPRGILDEACAKRTDVENDGYFYRNGLVAYLNAFGIVLDSNPSDPRGICRWLPAAYARALAGMDQQTNQYVWGKELGQAYGMAQRALGAIERCGAR